MPTRNLSIRLSVKDHETVKRALQTLGEDGQRALKRIETASKPASNGLLVVNAAAKEGKAKLQQYAAQTGSLGNILSALGPGGMAAAAGIGALTIGLTAAIQRTKSALASFDKIAKTADKLGVSTDALQELRHAADLTGVSQEKLDMALQRISRRAGDAARGVGEAVKIFQSLGVSVKDTSGNMRPMDDIINDVADAIRGMGSESEQLSATVKLVDSEAAGMVNLFKLGSTEMERMRKQARELGIVIDENLLRNAEKTNDQLSILSKVIDANLNRAFINLAPLLISTAQLFADLTGMASKFFDSITTLPEERITRQIELLNKKIKETEQLLQIPQSQRREMIVGAVAAGVGSGFVRPSDASLQQEIENYKKAIEILQSQLSAYQTDTPTSTALDTPPLMSETELAALFKQAGGMLSGFINEAVTAREWTVPFENHLKEMRTMIETNAKEMGLINADSWDKLIEEENKAFAERIKKIEKSLDEIEWQYQHDGERKRELVQATNDAIESETQLHLKKIEKLQNDAWEARNRDAIQQAQSLVENLRKELMKPTEEIELQIRTLMEARKLGIEIQPGEYDKMMDFLKSEKGKANLKEQVDLLEKARDWRSGTILAMRDIVDQAGNLSKQFRDSWLNAFDTLEDQLTSFITKGKFDFAELVDSIANSLTKIAVRQAITMPLASFLGMNVFGGSANLFTPMASGGNFLADQPLLVGERGPELVSFPRSGSVIPNEVLRNITNNKTDNRKNITINTINITNNGGGTGNDGFNRSARQIKRALIKGLQ